MRAPVRGARARLLWPALLAALLLVLAACGGGANTLTSQTAHYKVDLTIDGSGFGNRTATIVVRDLAGAPAQVEQVVFAPVMQSMGMAAPEVVAQPLGGGRYQASGAFFSMAGDWKVDVRVSAGGAEEVASFTVPVTE